MLKKLIVKNFAIIEDIELDFNLGMTSLTGETGAGKSLIIDTISLLCGQRADSDMIRYGANYASIVGIFSHDDRLNDLFNNNNIEIKNEIIVERNISQDKNTIKINSVSSSLSFLRQISIYFADIHIQNDTFKLFDSNTYLSFINPINDKSYDKIYNNYQASLYNYLSAYKKYEEIKKGINESKERLEFYEYELEEINNLDLYINIDKELEEEILKLENSDKISNNLIEALNNLEDDNISAIDNIYLATKALDKIKEYDEKYQDFHDKLLDSYYIISEIKDEINKEYQSLDFDPVSFDNKQEKLNNINKAKEKYKKSVEELIKYRDEIELKINIANNYDETLNSIKNDLINEFNKLKNDAINLSNYRKKEAINLEKGIIAECKDLDLENTNFKILFNEIDINDPFNKSIFLNDGIDVIDFLISFNKGEPLKPLHKVASGGEASRIMLAFKSFFAKKNKAGMMIFDEIDSGVSGKTAKKIAKKMKLISKSKQVLAITHLPSVCAIADNHLYIYKEEINDRTYTRFKYLDYEGKVLELAKMISGDTISVSAIEAAKDLIKSSND